MKKKCQNCRFVSITAPSNIRRYFEECKQKDPRYPLWCSKLQMNTTGDALRCGGDDYERNPNATE